MGIARPAVTEADGTEQKVLMPNEARLRGLTYASCLYLNIKQTITSGVGRNAATSNMTEYDRMYIGDVPIMLRSKVCHLTQHTQAESPNVGECPYDQVWAPVWLGDACLTHTLLGRILYHQRQ